MSGSGKVDQSQLKKYIELEKEIERLERDSPLKDYEVKRKAADDVSITIKSLEITLRELEKSTEKEKMDVQQFLHDSMKKMFPNQDGYNSRLSKEQEEYLEAKNKEDVARQNLESLKKQYAELDEIAKKCKEPADKLKQLYEERDGLLSDIFGGEYGSEKENKLEAEYDALMDKKQRISVAHYKWTSGRVLLQHAVNQMSHGCNKWKELGQLPPHQTTPKYLCATEARNNNIAACQNVRSCQRYLGDKIQFPYMTPNEVDMLERATSNMYIDMMSYDRINHAGQCYNTTMRRAAALLQWFDNVIKGTIQKDLTKVAEEAKKVETSLRAERIRLIRDKVAESGGDVKGLNDAGLKGIADGFSNVDQQKLPDEDPDLKNVGITQPAPVNEKQLPDAQLQEPEPPAPTPLPLSELAPMPCEDDLFGNIDELKEQYRKNNEEFMKMQDLNKARMEQGLQAKLAQRRHKKK